jgi:hypothetical protein
LLCQTKYALRQVGGAETAEVLDLRYSAAFFSAMRIRASRTGGLAGISGKASSSVSSSELKELKEPSDRCPASSSGFDSDPTTGIGRPSSAW